MTFMLATAGKTGHQLSKELPLRNRKPALQSDIFLYFLARKPVKCRNVNCSCVEVSEVPNEIFRTKN